MILQNRNTGMYSTRDKNRKKDEKDGTSNGHSRNRLRNRNRNRNRKLRILEKSSVVSIEQEESGESEEDWEYVSDAVSCPCGRVGKDFCLLTAGTKYNYCAIPNDANQPVGCYHVNAATVFVRNAWPVVVLWYGALLLFLLLTPTGRNAKTWIVNHILCCGYACGDLWDSPNERLDK